MARHPAGTARYSSSVFLPDLGWIVVGRENHGALESIRPCDEDAEPAIERVCGYASCGPVWQIGCYIAHLHFRMPKFGCALQGPVYRCPGLCNRGSTKDPCRMQAMIRAVMALLAHLINGFKDGHENTATRALYHIVTSHVVASNVLAAMAASIGHLFQQTFGFNFNNVTRNMVSQTWWGSTTKAALF